MKNQAAIFKRLILSLLLGFSFIPVSQAIIIDSNGTWSNPTGTATVSGVGTSTISWGNPTTSDGAQSSYNFSGNSNNINNASIDGSIFDLGMFTHNNYPIFNFNFTGADLDLSLDIFDGVDLLASETFSFTFGHNETANSLPCDPLGSTICPDVVSIPLAITSDTVNIFGENYTLELLGFSSTGLGDVTTQFITEEGQSNSATLYGSLVKASVPEPSSYLLLGIGLLGLAFRKIKS